jgi:hypothetical protein
MSEILKAKKDIVHFNEASWQWVANPECIERPPLVNKAGVSQEQTPRSAPPPWPERRSKPEFPVPPGYHSPWKPQMSWRLDSVESPETSHEKVPMGWEQMDLSLQWESGQETEHNFPTVWMMELTVDNKI